MSDKHSGSMEQVRDLLFGAQVKEMENANKKLEESLKHDIDDLRASMKGGFSSLESYVQSETASLLEKFKSENTALSNSLKNEQHKRAGEIEAERKNTAEQCERLSGEIKAYQNAVEQKISLSTTRFENVEKDLRKLIMSVNSELTELNEVKYKALVSMLNDVAAQIRHEDVSRAFISNLFLEMAMKLSDEANKQNADGGKGKKDE
jgi:flagellar biosynthesis/type III secretory pathway protein FliH